MLPILTRGELGEEWYRRVGLALTQHDTDIISLLARQVGIAVQENGSTVDSDISTLNFSGSDFNLTESPEGIVLVQLATPFTGLTVQKGDVTTDATITTIDFGDGIAVSESPEDEANVSADFGYTSTTVHRGSEWERTRTAYDGQAKTNATTTYSTTDMPSVTIDMPAAGTIEAVCMVRAGHSGDGNVDLRITIDGNSSTPIPRLAPSVGAMPIITRHSHAVSAGSRVITPGFRLTTAATGTVTISDAVLIVTAYL